MNSELNIEQSAKFKELYILLERVFRNKFFGLEDYFKSDVFFLRDDLKFHKYENLPLSNSNSKNNINVLYGILESISANGSDFKKLKIQVKLFIKKYSLELLQLQIQKDKISDKIRMFNIDETLNIIEQKLVLLKNNLISDALHKIDKSFMRISISRLDDFPAGEYTVKMKIRKLKITGESKYEIEESTFTLLPTIIKENTLVDLKERIKDYTFENQYLYPIEINFDELMNDDKILMQYSGTNLFYFELELEDKHRNKYKTSIQEIIDLYIKIISSFLTDFTQNNKELNLKLVANQVEPILCEGKYYSLIINVFFDIDQNVRKAILERIYYIFKNTISFRSIVENAQNNLINYFPDQADRIVDLLEKEMPEERNNCADCGCNII